MSANNIVFIVKKKKKGKKIYQVLYQGCVDNYYFYLGELEREFEDLEEAIKYIKKIQDGVEYRVQII